MAKPFSGCETTGNGCLGGKLMDLFDKKGVSRGETELPCQELRLKKA